MPDSTSTGSAPIPQQDQVLPIGTILFGEYEILGVLGGGGMGWVYKARHRSLGGLRAIKVVRPDLGHGPQAAEMFVREAKALIDLHHDVIVRCHDLLRDDQRLCLVMELVEGPTLERLLLRGPLPDDEVEALRRRLLEGLSAVHASGLVHRDISPANIVLPHNAPEEAKLIDFGIADPAAGKSQPESFRGNFTYSSPEQFGLFGGQVDARSDLYSLGLTLAAAAIGEPLLPAAATYFEAKDARKSKPEVPEYLPPDLRGSISALLEPDPRRRPASARAALTIETKLDDSPADNWLVSVLFTASAVGVGLGVGLTLWLWKFTTLLGALLPSLAPPVPVQTMPPAPPLIVGNPSPPPKIPVRAPASIVTPAPVFANPSRLTRAEIVATADRLASHSWICEPKNQTASCVRSSRYRSDFKANETIRGVAYDWGGIDDADKFDSKMAQGLAAGSHARDGITDCTAGIDCSGYVQYCWGHKAGHTYTTRSMQAMADGQEFSLANLKPGDALNRPGSHIVLFAAYRPDGGPVVYEASGRAGRVIRNERSSWSRFRHYSALRLKGVVDQ